MQTNAIAHAERTTSGIAGAGLQYGLPGTWNGLRERGMTPEDLTRLWSTHAAKLAGMQDRKGALAEGMDADIVVRRLSYQNGTCIVQ